MSTDGNDPETSPQDDGSSHDGGRVAIIAAASANLVIAATKFLAWALTGASSMLSEAIHSTADTGNQVVLMIGGRKARKEADEDHPFGYGSARFLSGFLVAVVMFSLGGLFAIWEAWGKLQATLAGQADELLESKWWWVPLAVLAASAIAEGTSLRTAVREARAGRGGQSHSLLAYVRRAKAPEVPVVMLEDSAAVIGLFIAFLGVGLTLLTGNGLFDAIGSALIGVLLIIVAAVLARETRSLLEGESASPEAREAIRKALVNTDGVDSVIHMKTIHLGPDTVLLAAKIAVDPTDSALEVARIIDAAEAAVRKAEPLVGPLYLEPDIRRGDTRVEAAEESS